MFIILTIALFVSLVFNVWLFIDKRKSKKEINRLNNLSFASSIPKIVYTPERICARKIYTREELFRMDVEMMDMESKLTVYFKDFAKRELMDRVIEYAEISFDVDYYRQQVEAMAEIKVLRPGE